MITKAGLSLLVLGALVFAGTFLTTLGTSDEPKTPQEPPPLAKCLGLDAQTAELVHQQDPAFTHDVGVLRHELDVARARLAELFENGDATDEEIREAIEQSIAAHNKLERRVADYLIAVRRHLTPAQQSKLFGLCASEVRECRKRCQQSGCAAGIQPASGAPCPPDCPRRNSSPACSDSSKGPGTASEPNVQ